MAGKMLPGCNGDAQLKSYEDWQIDEILY